MGTIVSFDYRSTKINISIDDGTGRMACRLYIFKDTDLRSIDKLGLGSFVVVRGSLAYVQSDMGGCDVVVNVRSIHIELDPNAEANFWIRAMLLNEQMYKSRISYPMPSKLSDDDMYLFLSCPCPTDETLKVHCLYCRCMARSITADKDGLFRDRLLSHLLSLADGPMLESYIT